MAEIYFIMGMKHSGKTTVGKIIADKLGLPFFDLDRYTEAAFRPGELLSCRDIYTRFGRESFMAYEAAGVKKLLQDACRAGGVCALGGGTIENEEGMRRLEGNGTFIYIDEDEEMLFNRIRRTGIPPFLQGPDPRKNFHELYQQRSRRYRKRADLRIEAEGENPENIALRILKTLRRGVSNRAAEEKNHGRK